MSKNVELKDASTNTVTDKHYKKIRVATFNVSMEALNYTNTVKGQTPTVTGLELRQALQQSDEQGSQQIRNIAEIIQRVNPDIILLNEFDYFNNGTDNDTNNNESDNMHQDNRHQDVNTFLNQYLAISQQGQNAINYPYFYQGTVNTGVKAKFDMNNNGIKNETLADTYGFGYFPGHFGMVLLSKYPIDVNNIRTFQLFKWKDMPNALKPFDSKTKLPWYNDNAWNDMRLSSKSHWDIPITINGKVIHILASHPTPPVFDGPEDRNGKRNHDEIKFWVDYISPKNNHYIYDDNQNFGGLNSQQAFIIMGDQNASSVEGDAINSSISALLTHEKIQDPLPSSEAGKAHTMNNSHAANHTAYWRMRADYVLPSKIAWKILDSAVFWPLVDDEAFRLVKNRQASSDHRLVWVDLELDLVPLEK